jgi:hypothetical protein
VRTALPLTLRRLYFETGHWRADFLTDRMTGSGRQREYKVWPASGLSMRGPGRRRSASWLGRQLAVPASCCRWTQRDERQQSVQSRSSSNFRPRLTAAARIERTNVSNYLKLSDSRCCAERRALLQNLPLERGVVNTAFSAAKQLSWVPHRSMNSAMGGPR